MHSLLDCLNNLNLTRTWVRKREGEIGGDLLATEDAPLRISGLDNEFIKTESQPSLVSGKIEPAFEIQGLPVSD